jgi:hypothetical protein
MTGTWTGACSVSSGVFFPSKDGGRLTYSYNNKVRAFLSCTNPAIQQRRAEHVRALRHVRFIPSETQKATAKEKKFEIAVLHCALSHRAKRVTVYNAVG